MAELNNDNMAEILNRRISTWGKKGERKYANALFVLAEFYGSALVNGIPKDLKLWIENKVGEEADRLSSALNGKTAILSGRFEIVHGGHICTIRRFGRIYSRLYVYIVDNPSAIMPSTWSKELIDFCTLDMDSVITVLDQCHFGYASQDDIDRLPPFDDFLCGNHYVADHLKGMGVNVVDFEQTPGYSSTNIKEAILRQAIDAWRRVPENEPS